jgi:hypothetical protein
MHRIVAALLTFATLVTCRTVSAERRTTRPPENPLYKTIADDVYLQEVGRKIVTDQPVTALAALENKILAIADGKLLKLAGETLQPVDNAPAALQRLFVLDGKSWATTPDALYQLDDAARKIRKVLDGAIVDMCLHNGAVHAATSDTIYRLEGDKFVDIRPKSGWLTTDTTMIMEDGAQVLVDPIEVGPITRIASYSGTLYLLQPNQLALLDGDTFVESPVDWGGLPSQTLRDMLAHGSQLLIATDRGLAVLRGAAVTTVAGKDGLPYEEVTCLAPGFDGDLWIGTSTGAIRNTNGNYHYFGAHNWLPGENVHDIAVSDRTVYIATDRGLAVIEYKPFTLAKKAEFFEKNVAARGHKRLGFVHELYWLGPPDTGQFVREISDNDGGHTAHYLAALCYKFAVTGDEQTRRDAVDAFEAMQWLQTITGTDGFFARSIWAVDVDPGHRSTQGSGGLPAKWVTTKDGRWMWKGDTSSDEVNGHFYAVSLFHDLVVARGDEKKRAAEHLSRITKHIVDNGWVLRDVDGKPTRWGRWDPQYLLRPYGYESRGLNGMEAQTYVWTALNLSGNDFYRKALDQLLEWKYETYTVREKLTFPPENVVTWDDELAFRCFHPLITYCDDPRLRSIYLRALTRHWEVMRMQKIPYFNFSYGGLTGNDCEAEQAVEHLREWSLDTVSHSYRNSHRADLAPEPGYTPYAGGTRAISPREQACTWGSRSSIEYDGGRGGRGITPPVGWLEDYWMGRYYGMIAAPVDGAASETNIAAIPIEPAGAAPYNGPPRPPYNAK